MSLLTSIVSYWKFDENTGTVLSDASGTNTGNWQGNAGSQWQTGKINSGLNFNGGNNYVSVPDSTTLSAITGSCSVQAWANFKTVNTNNQLLSKRATYSATGIPYELTSTGGGTKNFSWRTIGNTNQCNGTLAIQANTWYHVVGVWDGTTSTLYVNNVVDGTISKTGAITTNGTNINIGAYPNDNEAFTGTIDEVSIWNRALSAAEVGSLYNGGAGLQYPFTTTTATVPYRSLLGVGL